VYRPGPRPRNDPEQNFLRSRVVKLQDQAESQILAGVRKSKRQRKSQGSTPPFAEEPQP
jgi:hypothetical protein